MPRGKTFYWSIFSGGEEIPLAVVREKTAARAVRKFRQSSEYDGSIHAENIEFDEHGCILFHTVDE